MRMIIFTLTILLSPLASAGSRSSLKLSGFVTSQSVTHVNEQARAINFSQWEIVHQNNSINVHDEKIEIEGMDQDGLQGKITKITTGSKFIQHRLLLDLVTYNNSEKQPVVLKISAN